MRRHRRKHRKSAKVELNLAAMLDMAFQLLAFFVLTFRPTPIEGHLQLNLPPPVALTKTVQADKPAEGSSGEAATDWETLDIFITSDAGGDVADISVGMRGQPMLKGKLRPETLRELNKNLKFIFDADRISYDRVQLVVDGRLRYEELMKVVDVCTKQVLPDGKPLNRLSFIDMPNPGGS